MSRSAPLLFPLVLAVGCASSGDPTADAAPSAAAAPTATSVPVFNSPEDVPCEYEVIRTVRGESPASAGGSPTAYERERVRVLGREGARIGANAVLVEPVTERGVQRRVVVSAPAGTAPVIPPPPNLQFEGEALRYMTGCPANR